MSSVKIGIIGGSGLSSTNIIENRTEKFVDTPYGKVLEKILHIFMSARGLKI